MDLSHELRLKENNMAGGKRIDDHSSWIGDRTEKNIFPSGMKEKYETSAEGAGEENQYEDTTEAIRSQQEMGKAKAKAHPTKANYRN
jgi:hypothetical protein